MIKAVVFDFDDTLVLGTERKKQESFWEIFRDSPKAILAAKKVVVENAGLARQSMFEKILEEFVQNGIPGKSLEDCLKEYGMQTENIAVVAPAMPGAVEALKTLSAGYELYINSATPGDSILRIVEGRGWARYFKAVFGSPPGSKSGHLKEILEITRAKPEEIMVVGDGKSDFKSAEEFGCKFVGVKGDFSDFSENTFPVLSDLNGLMEIIRAS